MCAHHVECLCCVSPAGIRQLDSFGWILIVSLLACHGTRSGKVRSLSARLKIPTGAAARIVEPGSVEWLELQRGAAYTPSSGSPAAGSDAATALAGIMTGGSSAKAQRSTSVEEANVGVETTTAKDSTNLAAKQRYALMCVRLSACHVGAIPAIGDTVVCSLPLSQCKKALWQEGTDTSPSKKAVG